MRRSSPSRSFLASCSGASFVEAAVVLPVLLIIVGGAFDFGRAFALLADAQRDLRTATRFLSRLPAQAVCGWGLIEARNLAVYGNVQGTGSPHLTGWTTTDIVKELPAICSSDTDPGVVKLSAKIRYRALMWRTVGLPGELTFAIEHEERWQGE